jgi:Beta propeller domain.
MPPRPSEYFSGAVVLEFTKSGGFREKGRIPYDYNAGTYGGNTVRRLCYIGNYLYYVQDNAVRGFELDTLKPVL